MLANVFENIWGWVSSNLPSVLSGTTFVTVLAVIRYVVRLVKELRGATSSNAELGNSLREAKTIQKSVDAVKSDVSAIQKAQDEANDMMTVLDKELKALLEIIQLDINSRQSLPDKTRVAVNTIATNAKYALTHVREEIAKQAQEMAETAQKMANDIAETASKTQKIVQSAENPYKVNFGG